jgi:O-antigen/teichoic acid export membrane protein
MKPVTWNLIANYIGKSWAMLVTLIATPLLINILGIESYGLIGFYMTLYSLINLLDFGISPTINRELALYSVDDNQHGKGRDLVRTLETGYWAIGILLGVAVYFGAPMIATNWLQSSKLSIDTLTQSIRLMGFLVVLEWPITFYSGALLGMQRHVILNTINIFSALFKYGGALMVLHFVSPTVDAFFYWSILVSAISMAFMVYSVWKSLPASGRRPNFDLQLLERIWKFALSLNAISFISLAIHQMDKLFVSHYFSLEIFGYYNLATMVANGFTILVTPIFTTYFPRLSTLVAKKDDEGMRKVYHEACQLVSVAILPAVTTGVLFATEVIKLWTGNPDAAAQIAPIAALLLIGTACNALSSMPYQAQVSYGWTDMALWSYVISFPVVVGLLFVLNNWFGIMGVASIWVIHNILMLVITVPLMHVRILKQDFGPWLWQDTVFPLAVCLGVAAILMGLEQTGFAIRDNVLGLLGFAAVIQSLTILVTPITRRKMVEFSKKALARVSA